MRLRPFAFQAAPFEGVWLRRPHADVNQPNGILNDRTLRVGLQLRW
ncbi:MAG: hypothetical protein IT177_06515 [Acidobacteria bacterium]|nr:hypothetical protein [Acidobacteriota bacterium]